MPPPTCPDDEALVELCEGRLATDEAEALERHVDGCAACSRLVAAFATASFEAGETRPPLGPGAPIGRYVVTAFVGAGAMGRVYAAYDPQLDRKVAIKLLPATALPESDRAARQARLLREAQALARVNHPNVTAVYDAGLDGDQPFFAMELVAGVTVAEWLGAEPRARATVLALFVEAGRGLAAVHAAGLVHRDFKPTNVMVTDTGHAKVTDFGLARGDHGSDGPAALDGSLDVRITQSGALIGTPRYMAPEQLAGREADARSDQFAFCIALHEALTGQPPFVGGNLAALAAAYESGDVRIDRALPRWLAAVLRRGLAIDPSARFPSIEALCDRLDAAPRRRRRLALVAGALVVVGAATFAGRALQRPADPCAALAPLSWTPAQAQALRQRFTAAEPRFGATVADSVLAEVDRRATRWATMQKEACVASRVAGAESELVYDLRAQCIAAERADLAALLALFETPDHDLVRDAPRLVAQLLPVERCADTGSLRATDRPPLPVRAEVNRLELALAQPRAELAAGRYRDAAIHVEALAAPVVATAYQPLAAELELLRAAIANQRGEHEIAAAAAERAIFAAMAGRDERRQFEACRLLAIQLVGAGTIERAQPWLACAHATGGRLAVEHDVQAELLYLDAQVADRGGDPRAALALHERAVAERVLASGRDDPSLIPLLMGLAVQSLELGHADDAVRHTERAVAIATHELGAEHIDTAKAELALGYALAAVHRGADAIAVLLRAQPVLERELGAEQEDVASLHEAFGDAYDSERRERDAIEHYERAIAIRRARLGAAAPAVAAGLYNLGTTLNRYGHYRQALEKLDAALPIYRAANSAQHITVGVCHFERGRALFALGQTRAAAVALAAARPILVAQLDAPDALGEFHELCANVAWAEHRRADALRAMHDAIAVYRSAKLADAEKRAEDWLQAH